jgi:hypothetical protein
MSRFSTFLLALLLLIFAGFTPSNGERATGAPVDPPKKEDPVKDPSGFGGRTGKEKARLLKEFGGSEASEEAVMLGLAWLTQKQNKDGSWTFDGAMPNETSAATGLSLLAFLGAGQSHKVGRYQQTVQAGLDWLVNNVDQNGRFMGATTMYGQGIATLALCEAYGLTQDRNILAKTQAAVNFIQKYQGQNGSWGYQPGTMGDNSIVGWQIQALHAASLTQDLKVDKNVIKKAIGFLNYSGAGQYKSMYGYLDSNGAMPATNLTSIGLLMRYYIDGWRSDNRGFAEGVKGLMARAPTPKAKPQFDMYFYYYATQVVRFYGKEEWATWNDGPKAADGTRKGGVQDWLISLQDRAPTNRGSWPPEQGQFIGQDCGRLGTTALCLLTLEVYYRYTPENANQK